MRPCRPASASPRDWWLSAILIGSGASQEQAIVGETPNLAARLQGIAEPNIVVIAEGTRRLVGNLLEFVDLGAQDLKGISGRVRAWAAKRAFTRLYGKR
jgi:class 3 adenylate cyclase